MFDPHLCDIRTRPLVFIKSGISSTPTYLPVCIHPPQVPHSTLV